MPRVRRLSPTSLPGALTCAALALIPAAIGASAEPLVPLLAYDTTAIAPVAAPRPEPASQPTPVEDEAAVRCIAKIVHHEARNQPRVGQVAVAQTLLNRLKAGGRFGGTICAVANQRGQFFDTAAYHPRENSADWQTALAVARDALGGAEPVVPGAMFFRAAYRPATGFFRTRERIAAVGDHVFYR